MASSSSQGVIATLVSLSYTKGFCRFLDAFRIGHFGEAHGYTDGKVVDQYPYLHKLDFIDVYDAEHRSHAKFIPGLSATACKELEISTVMFRVQFHRWTWRASKGHWTTAGRLWLGKHWRGAQTTWGHQRALHQAHLSSGSRQHASIFQARV